jgi:hypothetical protein
MNDFLSEGRRYYDLAQAASKKVENYEDKQIVDQDMVSGDWFGLTAL